MTQYQVSWTVDIDAESPKLAAQAVADLYFQERIAEGEPDTACVFKVRERGEQEWTEVDLVTPPEQEWTEVDLVTPPELEVCHVDTCLPDYWGGHHLPHVSTPVWNGMTLIELKAALRALVNEGVVEGVDYDEEDQAWHDAAIAAVEAIEVPEGIDPEHLFQGVEPRAEDDDGEDVYAYFVFVPKE